MRTSTKIQTCRIHRTLSMSFTQRDILDWRKKTPVWYPNDVKEKLSEGLVSFIKKIISDSNESMKCNQGGFFNNLSKKQRSVLKESLEADQNIVIMPSDTSKYCDNAIR